MTRVDEHREAQRAAERQRLEEQQQAKRREAREQFGRMVARLGEDARQAAAQTSARRAEQQKAVEIGRRDAAGATLLARRGIAAQTFTTALQRRGEAAVEKAHIEAKTRREELDEEKVRRDERRDAERHGASRERDPRVAIAGHGRRGRGSDGQGGEAEGGGGAGRQTQPLLTAERAKSPREGGAMDLGRAAAELVRELVDRVYTGVTPEGLSQFTIEFKEGVLGGARLDVVARDGRIACTFHTLDKNIGRLLKASEGQLARAFAYKGLTLERLAVTDS